MGREKLLDIKPDQELAFRFEVGKQASCTIRLLNNSRNHVAFKFMISTPIKKYFVRPNTGILLPGSSSDVEEGPMERPSILRKNSICTVIMAAPTEVPSDMQCKDNFLIKSVVVNPWDTVEPSQKLFKGRKYMDGDWKLKVVYVLPSHQQSPNTERSVEEGSSSNGSAVQERSLSDTEWQSRNDWHVGDLFLKSITIVFLCLIFWYLIIKMLPLLWSLTFMIIVFVIKMGKRLVSDSIEDWIEKTILYLCIHFVTALFRRKESRP